MQKKMWSFLGKHNLLIPHGTYGLGIAEEKQYSSYEVSEGSSASIPIVTLFP